MRYCCDKDINKVIAELVRDGWTFSRNRHGKLQQPNGFGFVVIPCTPSDHRSLLNLKRDIRRLEAASSVDPLRKPE